ncbi:nucleotidyltransferase family protein [Nocardia abscessus]|uniref:nucleotidyltransferase family protein n=1 Tax=Nocardia abscessus TaxID=120957 RepID=UPI00189349A3|nr:nucleotidyltransferase family protein [Nocardia abscessus]MBF6335118.1 nucleotidyltransferase family protein [Nocardia abscessus]
MSVLSGDLADDVEWRMLKRLCVMTISRSPEGWIEEWLSPLASGQADSMTLVNMAVRQKLAGTLATVIDSTKSKDVFDPMVREFLRTNLNANRVRNRVLTSEALRIAGRMQEQGFPALATKGAVLQYLVYNGDGSRRLSDIDFMIHPDRRREAASVLGDLGFEFGTYDRSNHRINPIRREDELLYRMYPDHLPHALKLRHDPLVSYVLVDFAFSLTWFQAPWQIDMDRALDNPISVHPEEDFPCAQPFSGPIRSLSVPFLWLFTVLHLFRETWIERDALQGGSTLAQYRDIIQLWNIMSPETKSEARLIIADNRTVFPVRWICEHADRIFGTSICDELGIGDPLPEHLLETGLGPSGTVLTWPGTLEQRLFSGRAPKFVPSGEIRLEDLAW